jgi:phosphatidylserine/phosphatidylglycerophosphate/cardiolipin synthase-like enzyme
MYTLRAQSSSSDVEVFFNYPVAAASSSMLDVEFTGSAISAKAVAMVDAAQFTVDLAAYNFDHAPLAAALERASDRGVRVRVLTDFDTRHPSLLSPVPPYFWSAVNDRGLMHHKFLVVDAEDPDLSSVMMGSTNFTDTNIFGFYNDAIVFRSKELTDAYTTEFELLWGSDTEVPDASRSLSGENKPNRTIKNFSVGDLRGDLYFSPNDEVSTRIISEITAAEQSVGFQLLVLTLDEIGDALLQAHNRGTKVFGVVDLIDSNSEFPFLADRGVSIRAMDDDLGDVHHKYGVFDVEKGNDATVITGSHNWTYSAETFHDENTVVVTGSAAFAELYYEAARARHCSLSPSGECIDAVSPTVALVDVDVTVGPNPTTGSVLVSHNLNEKISAYRIFNVSGQQIQGGLMDRQQQSHSLDFSHLAPQTIFLQLLTASGWSMGTPIYLTN